MAGKSAFICEPAPDHPGWLVWRLADETRFNPQALGSLLVRVEGPGKGRARLVPQRRHANLHDHVHGGATLALIDCSLFAVARNTLDSDFESAVTLDLSCQFIGPGVIGTPLDAVVEVLRETGRLLFLRGVVEQPGAEGQPPTLVAAFNATLRKGPKG